jgi:hypothetical protein
MKVLWVSTPVKDTPSLNLQLEALGTKCTCACLPRTIADEKCELGLDENLASSPISSILTGNTEATKSLGENSTASVEKVFLEGVDTTIVSVIVIVFVFDGGFGFDLVAVTAFLGAGEQID